MCRWVANSLLQEKLRDTFKLANDVVSARRYHVNFTTAMPSVCILLLLSLDQQTHYIQSA